MKIGAEAESMDQDVAAPRRRVVESTTEHSKHSTGARLPEAPVLIRLPDLYPSARDDAAVARLAGIQPEAIPTPPLSPPEASTPPAANTRAAEETRTESRTESVRTESVVHSEANQPLPGPGVLPTTYHAPPPTSEIRSSTVANSPRNTASSPTEHQRRVAEASCAATTIVSPFTAAHGACAAGSPLPTSAIQTAGLQEEELTPNGNATANDSLLPRILLAAERHDLGVHVFRVLLVTLLVASLYLVFERTRRDGAIAHNDLATAESDWDQDRMSDRVAARADAPSRRDTPKAPRKSPPDTEELASREFEAPVHRVAKRSQSESTSGRPDSEARRPSNPPASEATRQSREPRSTEEAQEPPRQDRSALPQRKRDDRTDPDATRTAGQPTESLPRGDGDDHDAYFPSTPVNFDHLPDYRGESDWPPPEIPWQPSSRYQDSPEAHAPAATPPSSDNSYTPQWEPQSYREPESNRSERPRTDEIIPPYTPVTLRPRSEPQYPPPGNYNPPPQLETPSSPYLPPTSFSPPASASNPASGWPTETLR